MLSLKRNQKAVMKFQPFSQAAVEEIKKKSLRNRFEIDSFVEIFDIELSVMHSSINYVSSID